MGPYRFTEENVLGLSRDMRGIYAIYDDEYPELAAYIGKSESCIRHRLLKHVRGNGNATIGMLIDNNHDLWFSFEETSNPRYDEAKAIFDSLKPVANKRYEYKPLREEWGSL
jgi:hypothetical protein